MVKLTNKDADFMADYFRKNLSELNEFKASLKEKEELIRKLISICGTNEETNKKLDILEVEKQKVKHDMEEQEAVLQKCLYLCIAGSENVEE